jgi:hypothetical protein
MKTKTMSALLRAVLLAAGALLAVFFFLFLPFYGTDTVRAGVCLGLLAVSCLGVGVCRADLLGPGPGVESLRQHCCKGYGLHWEKCP